MERLYTITAFTDNSPGVLHRLTTTLTRRKVNIESLTVSETEKKGLSRFTIVVKVTPELISKITKQIDRIIEVKKAYYSENTDLVFQEIAFIRVSGSTDKRHEIEELAHRYNAAIAFASKSCLIIEKTGSEDDINSLYTLLEPYGISEFTRSGRIAVRKEI